MNGRPTENACPDESPLPDMEAMPTMQPAREGFMDADMISFWHNLRA